VTSLRRFLDDARATAFERPLARVPGTVVAAIPASLNLQTNYSEVFFRETVYKCLEYDALIAAFCEIYAGNWRTKYE
jgi:hypothetical protein